MGLTQRQNAMQDSVKEMVVCDCATLASNAGLSRVDIMAEQDLLEMSCYRSSLGDLLSHCLVTVENVAQASKCVSLSVSMQMI